LSGGETELLDFAKDLIDTAGVLAENAAFQQQRIFRAGAVTILAVSGNALIGIETDNRLAEGTPLTVAMRRSVIFRSEGLELVLVFCGRASSTSSAQNAAARLPPWLEKNAGCLVCLAFAKPPAHGSAGMDAPQP